MLLKGKGYEFVNEYYDTIEKIYNQEVPLSKIANKSRVRMSVKDYEKRSLQLNVAGNPLPKQAHMELIIKEGLTVDLGDTIYYVNTGTKKSHGDVQKVNKPKKGWSESQMDMFAKEGKNYEEKKNTLLKNGWEMSWSEDNWVRSNSKNKEANTGISTDQAYGTLMGDSIVKLNCRLIPNDVIENNPDATGEYNIERYIDAFNKRIKPLLVCFSPEVRDDILITTPLDRQYFTQKQLTLTSGQPMKEGDQDTIEDLLTITNEERLFWDLINLSPTYMFEEYNIVDENCLDNKQSERSIL